MSNILTECPLVPDLRISHPSSIFIAGATGTGKSNFIKNLIECDGIKGGTDVVYYFMPRFENLDINPPKGLDIYKQEGLPDQEWVNKTIEPYKERKTLIVVDDMWNQCVESPVIEYLLTYGRRHLNLSLIFVAQNFYEKSRKAITLRYFKSIRYFEQVIKIN
jgi:Cdc6-like AAA superfamily ATPase